MLLVGVALTLLLGNSASAQDQQNAVLIVLGGGVRSADLFDGEHTPQIQRLAQEGAYNRNMRVATIRRGIPEFVLTSGAMPEVEPKTADSWAYPSILECFRKQANAPIGEAWLIRSGPARGVRSLVSGHADFGAAWAPSLLEPDGILTGELSDYFKEHVLTHPGALGLQPSPLGVALGAPADKNSTGRVLAQFMLDELQRKNADLGEGDARALRAGLHILKHMKPRLTVIVLRDAETFGRRIQDGHKVLRRIDQGIGAIAEWIRSDPQRKNTFTLVVATDHGRNAKASPEGRLLDDDGSRSVTRAPLVFWGPRFLRKQELKSSVKQIDVAPTVAQVLGFKMEHATGHAWRAAMK